VKFLRSRRGLLTTGILLLLALFLIRPGANRLRTRIVESISLAMGRPVEVASVSLRLLPQPGFELENFVVYDDPAFGAEPMLRADEVTASLRLASLLRGRLQIARLDLTEPSLNMVRNSEGHWNLEALLERAEKLPVGPTAEARLETRPAFPYIEAGRGRINFKLGQEKKPYALTDADFSLWQDSENTWSMRLKAQPMRTDFNLSDTGLIRVNGSWQRAATLRDTPLNFSLAWERAQLGQLTKLLYGGDQGWRGTVNLAATLTGIPANLAVSTDASADDFRHYDIMGGGSIRLAAHCTAQYSTTNQTISQVDCQSPVGHGMIAVSGSIAHLLDSRNYDLTFATQDLPLESLLALVRHAKPGVPDDLLASGQLGAKVTIRRTTDAGLVWEGGGETSEFHLTSSASNADLALDRVRFALVPPTAAKTAQTTPDSHVEIGPLHVALGKTTPALVHGWISRSGYGFQVEGDVQLQRFLQTLHLMGIPALPTTADGSARLDVQIAGAWSGAAPRATGAAQLHSIQAELLGWKEPLEIASATLVLTPDRTSVRNLNATVAGATWRGSLLLPRPCRVPETCPVNFDLHADQIALERLNQLLNPKAATRPWYRFLSSPAISGSPYLLKVNATGKLTANQVLAGKFVAHHLSANLELQNGKLLLSDVHADVLGGKHSGEWTADFSRKPPEYSGKGTVERVELGQLAQVMNDDWITGSATATYRVNASGLTSAELLASAGGSFRLEAWDGVLPHIVLAGAKTPLQMRHLAAYFVLRNGKFEIQDGKLATGNGTYEISGSASLNHTLNVKLTRDGAPGFDISGTIREPRVSPATSPETQAALKP